MRVSHVKRVCTLQCHVGLPLRGKDTQDTIQDVQYQDMESRGAITKVETTRYKNRIQDIKQGEALVKRALSPHIPSRDF